MLHDSGKDDSGSSAREPKNSAPSMPKEAAAPSSSSAYQGSDPLVGKVLMDRIRIVRPIARGGMGRVYLGEQTRMKRRCAVKVLDPRWAPGGDATDYSRRFLLEASVAAKLTHPNVVTIFDYGETPEGCFIAMEHLKGRSLSDELSRVGRIAPDRAIHIATQVCRALREAHELGVVHRDIKPGNIFLVRQDDDDDFVKVLDFGLVHDSKAHDARESSAAEAIMGSPRYMAPEQVQGKEVDARADIYSLGVVLYAMLTGHPPFERRTELATMMAHVSDAPPEMQSVAPDLALPTGLEAIVMRCLAKNPEARYGTMEELAQTLQGRAPLLFMGADSGQGQLPNLLAPSPQSARAAMAPSLPEQPRRRWVGVVVALAAAATAASIWAARQLTMTPYEPAVAAAPPPPAATLPPAPPPPQARVTIHVDSDPPGAKVNEEGETLCPSTPCDIVYVGNAASPNTEHLLAFLLPGYKLERKIAKPTGSPVVAKLTKAR